MDCDSGVSFLALVHHNGEIKRRSWEGVKFKSKCPTNVFITSRISFLDLQASVVRKLGLDTRKRVSHIYYRVPVAVVSTTVKYDCLSIKSDKDLQADHPQPIYAGPSHVPIPLRVLVSDRVTSPSFDVNLQPDNDDACDLGDNHSSVKLAVAVAGMPRPPSPNICHAVPDPMVEESLRCNDSDEEPALIEGDSDDDEGTIPVARDGPSSFGTQQYPPHFSTLNLEVGYGVSPVDRGSGPNVHGLQGSHGSNVLGEFRIGQTFQTKEEALLALKNYNIRRGVEYRVLESDHAKYHGK
ncbi:hypothetical protein PIB30_060679 [Stylosanthes scabra]|uniref:Uncharacterized protein n=1 Tax=Stylosanthes scabra TaxID=79078 RepID=A0ABU6QME5_9FABA|nr:hypothetical protein [Stylosanthes scabra]